MSGFMLLGSLEVSLLPNPNPPSNTQVLVPRCPRCKEKLSPHTVEELELQVCTLCGGLWIGLKEFREAVRKPPPQGMENQEEENVGKALWEESKLECPICGLLMSKGRYAYSSGVIIDRCQNCGGIWLDRGELARLRAFVNRPVPKDRVLMAQMQAQALKRRAQAKELAQTREMSGGVSLGQILKLLKDILS